MNIRKLGSLAIAFGLAASVVGVEVLKVPNSTAVAGSATTAGNSYGPNAEYFTPPVSPQAELERFKAASIEDQYASIKRGLVEKVVCVDKATGIQLSYPPATTFEGVRKQAEDTACSPVLLYSSFSYYRGIGRGDQARLARFRAASIEDQYVSYKNGLVKKFACADEATGIQIELSANRTIEGFKKQIKDPSCQPLLAGQRLWLKL